MALEKQQLDPQGEQRLQGAKDQDAPQRQPAALPPELVEALQKAGSDPARLVAVIQAQPAFKAAALDWVESSLGLAARAQVLDASHGTALVTVRAGDTLSKIAREQLGDASRWPEIHGLNKAVIGADPNKLKPGWRLVMPKAKSAAGPAQGAASQGPAQGAASPQAEVAGAESGQGAAAGTIQAHFGHFAQEVANKTKASEALRESSGKQEAKLGQHGKERFESRGALGARDRLLFAHSDPVLGKFEVVLGLEGDISARAHQRFFTISSQSGLLIRTPEGMSDLRINGITVNLQTMAVHINSQPEVGPLERKIITGLLQSTLLATVPELARQGESPVAAAMTTLPMKDGSHVLWDLKGPFDTTLLAIMMSPETMAGVKFNKSGLELDLFPGLQIAKPGRDIHVAKLCYDFATATFSIEQQGATTVFGVIANDLRQPLLNGIAMVGSKYFRTKLPAVMRQPGYDPTLDPKFTAHLDQVYQAFTGVSMLQPATATETTGGGADLAEVEARGQGGRARTGGPVAGAAEGAWGEERAAHADEDVQLLYRMQAAGLGTVEVCLEKGDKAEIFKDASAVGLQTQRGFFLRVPGQPWLEEVRLRGLRYDLVTQALDVEGSERLGDFVRSILEDLVNVFVLPQLPGEVQSGLGLGGMAPGMERQVLYSAELPQAGRVELALDAADRLVLEKSATAIEMRAAGGMIISAPGFAALGELRVTRIHYALGSGQIIIDADRDIGPMVEGVVAQLVRHAVVPQLPGGLEGLGLAGPETGSKVSAEQLAAYPEVVYETTLPVVGAVQARLAAGDTLGVGAGAEAMRVYSGSGLLITAPEVGIAVTFHEISVNYLTGAVEVVGSEALGAFERSLLSNLSAQFLLPMVAEYYQQPAQGEGAGPDVLYRFEGAGQQIDVCLDKGDEIKVEKSATALTLSSAQGILLRSAGQLLPPDTRLDRIHLDMQSGKVVVDSRPDVGDFGELIATKVLRALILPHLPPELALVGITAPTGAEPVTEMTPPDGMLLYAADLPGVGAFDASIAAKSAMQVDATATTMAISAASGLLIRVPSLDLAVRIQRVFIDRVSGQVQVEASTPLGGFEDQLLDGLFRTYGMALVSAYLGEPAEQTADPGFDTLYRYSDPGFGDFAVCTPKGGGFSVNKSETHLSIVSEKGVFLSGGPMKLPDFKIHALQYELGTGRFNIEVSGVAQGHYVENQAVGSVTKEVVANVVKAVVVPHLPPQALELGIVGFSETEAVGEVDKGNRVFSMALPALGELAIYLDRNDSFSVSASEREGLLRSSRGLLVEVPSAQISIRIKEMRYHFETGEVQVDGLGALENAVIESALVQFMMPLLPQEMQGGASPVGAFMENLPADRKGRRQLMKSSSLDLYLMPGTRFDVQLAGGGLRFKAQPGIFVDSVGAFNYKFQGVVFDFKERQFKVDIAGDNVLAGIFRGVARSQAEKALNKMLLPLLPPEMLTPGYDLMKDKDLMVTMSKIVANFSNVSA